MLNQFKRLHYNLLLLCTCFKCNEMPDSRLTIGNFSDDDGDVNEDVKKAKLGILVPRAFPLIRFITQNNNFSHAYITHFCRFLYRPGTTTTWKCLIASFMEDANRRRRISFSLSNLECGPQEINSREICLHLPFSANWPE